MLFWRKISVVILLRKTRSFSCSNFGAIIGGGFSLYAGILSIVLCRQQVYVLKRLFALVIIHLLFLLGTVILSSFSASLTVPKCERLDQDFQDNSTESPDDFCEVQRKKEYQTKILGIVSTITLLLLLLATIFNLVITVRERRARRQLDDDNNSRNSYLLLDIPLLLRQNFRKTSFAYIGLGALMIGLDAGILLNGPLIR